MKRTRIKVYIQEIVYLILIAILIAMCWNFISCGIERCSVPKYEKELKSVISNDKLEDNNRYLDAISYANPVFEPYIRKDNISTSKIYQIDEDTIIQYFISAGTDEGIGIIYRRVYSETAPNDYSIVMMHHTGVVPICISAIYKPSYFTVTVSLKSNCEPRESFSGCDLRDPDEDNYEVFEYNYGKEIITQLHGIYVEHTEQMLEETRDKSRVPLNQ